MPRPPVIRTPPTRLQFGSLSRLVESLPRVHSSGRALEIDLRNLRWIEALPLAVLAAYVNEDNLRRGIGGRIVIPRSYGFLQRMDLFTLIGADLPETFKRRDSRGRFVPLCEVKQTTEVQNVAAQIVDTLRVEDPEAALVLRHCVGELVDNVFVHANSPTNAIVCAQHFPKAFRTQVGIVDTGIGFRGSFLGSPLGKMTRSDRDAITLGLSPFVTSKPFPSGLPYAPGLGRLGVGLFIVSEVLSSIGGQVLVCSGDAMYRRKGNSRKWLGVKPWQGAILGFEVPDEPLVSYEVALREARRLAREQQ